MENITFDKQAEVVASAFVARNDEEHEAHPILKAVFERHDMSGALALSYANGDIEIKADQVRVYIMETFSALNAIFDFDLSEGADQVPEEVSEDSSE